MTIDDIRAAIAVGQKVTGHYVPPAMRGEKREVRIGAKGLLELWSVEGHLAADNVHYLSGDTVRVAGVGLFKFDPLPAPQAPDTHEYFVYAEGKGGPSVKHTGYNAAVEEATRIAQKLKTAQVYVLRIDAVVECEHTPVVKKC
jgi:hypothetical protein